MYEIYFNGKKICLTHTVFEHNLRAKYPAAPVLHYTGKTKFILNCLDKLLKDKNLNFLFVLADDVKRLWKDFKSLFKIVPAAGGLVLNEKQEILLIYRRGFWDLPKGKLEKKESKKEAAIREVKEECGLKDLSLIQKLGTTFHVYPDKGSKRVLKPSYWYLMFSTQKKLLPQKEEDIEKAIWASPQEFEASNKYIPVHANIRKVIALHRQQFWSKQWT